jgi:hypothetical protein
LAMFSLVLLSLYLTILSTTSPTSSPRVPTPPIALRNSAPPSPNSSAAASFSLSTPTLSFSLSPIPSLRPSFCPSSSHLLRYPCLFTWSLHSAICLSLIYVGVLLRLEAYSALGRNFTFKLAEPDRLITTGLYRYVRHPSYVGQVIVLGANLALLGRLGD